MFKFYKLKRIKNLSIIPRWVIFLLDMIISSSCFLLAYLIKNEFNFRIFEQSQIGQNLLILLAFNVSLFSLFKVYAGIIRFTGLQDTFRIFFVVFFTNVGYYVLDFFYYNGMGFD
jgi:FlaA1/EpsC-like NDP-sugar epimerase